MSPCIKARRARPLLGTFVEIGLSAPNESILRRAFAVGFIAIAEVQRLMNRHDPASEISRLNRAALQRKVSLHRWTLTVLRTAQSLASDSGGAFDATRGPESSWRDLLIDDAGAVRFRRPLKLDLGGIAKGFAVDRAVDAVRKAGAIAGIVNAGGDLRAFGDEPQSIHIRHPLDPGHSAGTVVLRERALATSAAYFAPALFDGRSGAPIGNGVSATVAAPDCLTADGLTKISLALETEAARILARHDAEAFLLRGNSSPCWLRRQ